MGLLKFLTIAVGIGLLFTPFASAGVSLIISGGLALLAKSPTIQQRLQGQSVMVRSAVKPQEILYGEDRKSGVVVYFDTSGDDNEFLWFVIAIVEHEIDSYTTLWLDDVAIDVATEIDGSGFVTKADFVDADGNMLVKTTFYTGLDSQTADADLVAAFTEWTTDHKGEGVAYLIVRLELDRSDGGTDPENSEANVFSRGYPRSISVTAKGALVYDPRLDSTNGGAGTHRADTTSTWEWSENSILCRTDYLRSSRFGPGYTSSEVIWPTVLTNADIAEDQVSIPDSGLQDRYTFNGVVDVSDSPKAVIEAMQSADHGVTLFTPAGIDIRVGAWDASSWTIDETWIAGTYSYTSAISTDDTYNAVRGQYLSADADYTLIEFQPITAPAYETEDGGTRVWQDVILPFTNEDFLAQRIAIIEVKKSRQQKTVQLECNFRARLVEPFQIVTLDLPGIDNETYRVIGKEASTDGIVKLSLREEVESDWTYDVPDLATPPVIPGIIRGDVVIPPPTGLATAGTPEGVRLTWTLPAGKFLVEHIEIYAHSSNSRGSASRIAIEPGESYVHLLAVGTVRYYWILARGINNLVSTWEPTGEFSGVQGTAGGENIVYYIKPMDGTAIHNSSGTLTIEAHKIEDGVDAILSSGTIKLFDPSNNEVTVANGYATGSDGYTGVLDSGDISGAKIITMKDGVGGTPLDTVSLVDIQDGATGEGGTAGGSVAELSIYRRASSAPSTPTGGSYDFDTKITTPPTNWSSGVPAGTDPVYISRGVAFVVGLTGVDSSITWSSPVHILREGDSVDIVFKRQSNQPSTPSPSPGTPATWYSDVDSVPGGGDPIWSSVGTRANSGENWVWQVPLKIEGSDGTAGVAGEDAVYGYIEASNTLAWSRAPNSGAWTPSGLTTDLDVTFVQGGVDVARIARRITLASSTGFLTIDPTTHKHASGDLNTGRVSVANSGVGSTALTSRYTYADSGDLAVVAETVSSAQGGDDGDTGPTGDTGDTGSTGPTGADGVTWHMTNQSPGIVADSGGSVTDLSNTGTALTMMEGDTALTFTTGAVGAGEFRVLNRTTRSPTGITLGSITGNGTDTATAAAISAWTDTSALTGYIEWSMAFKRIAGGDTINFTIRRSFTINRAGGGGTTADDVTITSQTLLVINAGSTTVGYRVHSDGTIDGTTTTSGVYANIETWLNVGSNSDYDVKMVKVSGVGSLTSGSLDTWLNCGSTRTWSKTTSNNNTWQGQLSIRDATSGTILDTITVMLDHQTSA